MRAAAELVGRAFGRFRVLELIGAGGMGMVFRAHDEQLERDVAIKVLPAGALDDEDSRRRFRHEALALSRVNHPHIATIFDFIHHDGLDILVMELVPGVSLDHTLAAGGALPEQEVARIGAQIASALEEAHERSIVHRDLKPANVMVTPKGHVKVVDFGLARLLRQDAGKSTASITQAVSVSGTLAYMAPEQLQGRPADMRSDIWALGMVLFEMATGRPAFPEKLPTALVDRIMNATAPAPSQARAGISPQLDFIVLKCLEKNPGDRYQSVRELTIDLRRLVDSDRTGLAQPSAPPLWRRTTLFAGALLVLGGVVAALFVAPRQRDPGVSLPLKYEQLTSFADPVFSPAVSPDGRMLAFVRRGQIHVKLLPAGEPVQITDTPGPKAWLEFTPDGSRISYTEQDTSEVWTVGALGGQPRLLLRNAETLRWIDDQHVLFSRYKRGIHLALVTGPVNGSDFRDVYVPPTELGMVHDSHISPDRKWVLLREMDATGNLPCRVVPFDGSSAGRQVGPLSGPCHVTRWSPDGRWMYFSSTIDGVTHIWRQRFPDGDPEQVTFGPGEERQFALTPDGRALIVAVGTEQRSVWLHYRGEERPVSVESYTTSPVFSPDGKTLYYLVRGSAARSFVSGELWAADLASGQRHQVFPGIVLTHYSISFDGAKIVFTVSDEAGRSSIWIGQTDGNAPPRQLIAAGAHWPHFANTREILFLGDEGPFKYLYRINADGSGRQKLVSHAASYVVNVSPRGDWAVLWAADSDAAVGGAVPAPRFGRGRASQHAEVRAYPLADGDPVVICACQPWWGTTQGAPLVHWDAHQKYVAFTAKYLPGMDNARTYVAPLGPNQALPALQPSGISTEAELTALAGVRMIPHGDVFLGPDPDTYAYFRSALQQNLYRVPVQ